MDNLDWYPTEIVGPFAIRALRQETIAEWAHNQVVCQNKKGKEMTFFISDLVETHCGVFLSKEDGDAYLLDRKRAYKTDSLFRREVDEHGAHEKSFRSIIQDM